MNQKDERLFQGFHAHPGCRLAALPVDSAVLDGEGIVMQIGRSVPSSRR